MSLNHAQVTYSPAERRALEQLAELDRNNPRAGADLRMDAYHITEGLSRLRAWLAESDRLVDDLPGAKRLRRRRRRGILRHTGTLQRGMPYFGPQTHPTAFSPEPRIAYLKDELELVVIAGRREGGRWRPAKDELTFDEARALAAMKVGTLYRLTSKRLVPGLIERSFGNCAKSHTRELRFLTVEFMRWGVVVVRIFQDSR